MTELGSAGKLASGYDTLTERDMDREPKEWE
jgi:hypothetical protein